MTITYCTIHIQYLPAYQPQRSLDHISEWGSSCYMKGLARLWQLCSQSQIQFLCHQKDLWRPERDSVNLRQRAGWHSSCSGCRGDTGSPCHTSKSSLLDRNSENRRWEVPRGEIWSHCRRPDRSQRLLSQVQVEVWQLGEGPQWWSYGGCSWFYPGWWHVVAQFQHYQTTVLPNLPVKKPLSMSQRLYKQPNRCMNFTGIIIYPCLPVMDLSENKKKSQTGRA